MLWYVEEYFKLYSVHYRKSQEISHWNALERMKSLFEWPMAATSPPGIKQACDGRANTETLKKATRSVGGHRKWLRRVHEI